MTNQRSNAALAIMTAAVLSIGYGTYAFLSDTETSSGNVFGATDLDLHLNGVESVEGTLRALDFQPGDTTDPACIDVANTGSTEGVDLDIGFHTDVFDAPGDPNDPDDGGDSSAAPMDSFLRFASLSFDGQGFAIGDVNGDGRADTLADAEETAIVDLPAPGAGQPFCFQIHFLDQAGNDMKRDEVTLTLTFFLAQQESEDLAEGIDGGAGGGETFDCFVDADGDGVGAGAPQPATETCEPGLVGRSGDCDDADAAIHPDATEVANGQDDDCDGAVDEGSSAGEPCTGPNGEPGVTVVVDGEVLCDFDGFPPAGTPCDDGNAATENDVHDGQGNCVGTPVDCDDGNSATRDSFDSEIGTCVHTFSPAGTPCDDGNPNTVNDAADGAGNCVGTPASTTTCYADGDADGFGGGPQQVPAGQPCPAGHVPQPGDCDEGNANVNPGEQELANGIDDDCDGLVDEDFPELGQPCDDGDPTTVNDVYRARTDRQGTVCVGSSTSDADADGFGPSTDCDDNDPTVHPGATETVDGVDEDCDGKELCFPDGDSDSFGGSPSTYTGDADCSDAGESLVGTDCDDTDASVNPSATEVSNGKDDDCDGTVDEGSTSFADSDGDGFGDPASPSSTGGSGFVANSGDCDDTNPDANPNGVEILDPHDVDEDCDGFADQADPEGAEGGIVCAPDSDSDGFGASSGARQFEATVCPSGFSLQGGDCDDSSAQDFPGATEIVGNNDDEDCDGREKCFMDFDGDGFRPEFVIDSSDTDCSDGEERSSSTPAGDCDDASAEDRPGAPEIVGNGDDENCDGRETCFVDGDEDGFRSTSVTTSSDTDCNDPGEALSIEPTGDCNDANPSISPGDPEIPGDAGNIDENCNGTIQCFSDTDNDGFRTTLVINSADMDCNDPGEAFASEPTGDCADNDPTRRPGATEVSNGVDDDCDGLVDESP